MDNLKKFECDFTGWRHDGLVLNPNTVQRHFLINLIKENNAKVSILVEYNNFENNKGKKLFAYKNDFYNTIIFHTEECSGSVQGHQRAPEYDIDYKKEIQNG